MFSHIHAGVQRDKYNLTALWYSVVNLTDLIDIELDFVFIYVYYGGLVLAAKSNCITICYKWSIP